MDPARLAAELLFGLVAVIVVREYLRRRDAVSRDVLLAFGPLGTLVVVDLWRASLGPPPAVLSAVLGVLLLLQPLFVLHLASLVRDVGRRVLVGATILLLGTLVAAVLLRSVPLVAVLALAVFIAIEGLAALLLLLEARRLRGPGAVRLGLAAAATGLLTAALVSAGIGAIGDPIAANASVTAFILVLAAGVGYAVAFAPPPIVRRAWQSSATVDYVRGLIEHADLPIAAIWQTFARFAASVSGGSAFVVTTAGAGTAVVAAAAGAAEGIHLARGQKLDAEAVASLRETSVAGTETPLEGVGTIAAAAGPDGARYLSVIPLDTDPNGPLLVLGSRHRRLFAAADRSLLAALGAQTAIAVERRTVVAEQEALAERLAATVDALRAASQAKSDFLASMSHELRTPLSAILGFSDLMRSEPATDGSVSVPVEWVEHIHRGGEHLLALINDVLDLAKVEAGRLDLHAEPVDAGSLAAEVVNGLRPLAERKEIALSVAAPSTTVSADRGRLRQILYNLLSNAIKYTPRHGSVEVSVATVGQGVEIAVTDTGVGIAAEDIEAIFEEFRQVGAAEARQQGTGLGLALTKRLVEAHGGTITVESTPGVGSRFCVSLPVGMSVPAETSAAPLPRAVDDATHGRPDVLVIEDDPSAIRLLREYLEPAGYGLRVAASGETGLAAARARRPAAIVLDVLLPGVDGWEVLRRLKADVDLASIPVIIVTVVDERELGLALGAVDYIVKPIRRDALLASLARHVRGGTNERPRVLAVDDDPAALEVLRAALEPEGFDVQTTTNASDAFELLTSQAFDLVVSDVVMPEMDGFELARRLKADERTAAIPILLCTAHDLSASDKERLNGQIIGIASKGTAAREGLLRWLEPYLLVSRSGAT